MATLFRLALELGGAAVLLNGAGGAAADAYYYGYDRCEMTSLCGERSISDEKVPAGMGCHDFHDKIQWHVSTQEECEGIPMLWKPFTCTTVEDQLHDMPDCGLKAHWSRTCCENLEHLGGSVVKGVEVTDFACHREQSSQPWPFRRLQDERAAQGAARRLNGVGPPASPERMRGTVGVEAWVEEGPMDMLYEPNDVNGRYMFFGYANHYPLYRNTRKGELFLIHSEHQWHVALWELGKSRPKSIASSVDGVYSYHLSEVQWPQPVQNIVCGNFRGNASISMSPWGDQRPCVELPPREDQDPSAEPVWCAGLKDQNLPETR